ncbi:MAG: YeeE/YedE family protein [candidate division Zixibacteria bacterium]|nr:YeeE/YedE family protein [candidate division Zixibacteria bacterium]
MGPLVPEIFSNEFNLVIAFLIGIGFGFILEQAGFSATRKLAGLFYGYDFTVLKVFFTAGATAMIGVLALGHFDLLDLNLIYVNPTFLWSAIVGGCIMGAGFVIGGFCPGTSVCAAAIGKLDGMIFIVGSFFGILIFTEGYPLLKEFYLTENWGAVRIDKYLGISSELFAFFVVLIAAIAFIAVTRIENNVNNRKTDYSRKIVLRCSALGLIPFAIIALLTLTPSRQEYIQQKIREYRQQQKCTFKEISGDKLAYELVHNHFNINLIDVRATEKYLEYHLPLAVNIPVDSMMSRQWNEYFVQEHKINIFYADIDTTAKKACLLANFLGESENYILTESTDQFRDMFYNISLPPSDAPKQDINIYSFRTKAANDLMNLENALKKFSQPVKKKVLKAKGGCS